MTISNLSGLISDNIPVLPLLENAVQIGGIHTFSDYRQCKVLTNDIWKRNAGGVPKGTLLLATILNTSNNANQVNTFEDEEILLLRVEGPDLLYNESHILELRTEQMMVQLESTTHPNVADVLTRNASQFGGLRTKVIGTFYAEYHQNDQGESLPIISFSQDVETFHSNSSYIVYKPLGLGLAKITSFPEIKDNELQEGYNLPENPPPRAVIGRLRYSATNRRQNQNSNLNRVPVNVSIMDFVNNKTALFGMTRMGKSNTMKVIATETLAHSLRTQTSIGQLILDPSGEYSSQNVQDTNAGDANIIDIGSHVHRFQWGAANPDCNIHSVQFDFYNAERLQLAVEMLESFVRSIGGGNVDSIMRVFARGYTDVPGDVSETRRAQRRRALLYACLVRAGFDPGQSPYNDDYPRSHPVPLSESMARELHCVIAGMDPMVQTNNPPVVYNSAAPQNFPGCVWVNFNDLPEFFERLKQTHEAALEYENNHQDDENYQEWATLNQGSSGDYWHVDHGLGDLYNVLVPRPNFRGWRYFARPACRNFHHPSQQQDPVADIVNRLANGELCIVTSFGIPDTVMKSFSHRLVDAVIVNAKRAFSQSNQPPMIQVFIDEAHNVVGKKSMELDSQQMDPFTTLAKEGGKYNIGMIYATQEVSMIDDLILSNTANWVITHLNSRNEINVLSRYYDFEEFADSILNNEVVGMGLIRTRSSPYTLPLQIELFSESHIQSIHSLLQGDD